MSWQVKRSEYALVYILCVIGPVLTMGGEFDVQREAPLEPTPAYDRVIVDLGELPSGAVGSVELTVHNPTDSDIELGTFSGGCVCLKTTLSDTSLPAKGKIKIHFQLKTPLRPKNVEQRAAVTIAKSRDLTGRSLLVVVNYKIADLVAF